MRAPTAAARNKRVVIVVAERVRRPHGIQEAR